MLLRLGPSRPPRDKDPFRAVRLAFSPSSWLVGRLRLSGPVCGACVRSWVTFSYPGGRQHHDAELRGRPIHGIAHHARLGVGGNVPHVPAFYHSRGCAVARGSEGVDLPTDSSLRWTRFMRRVEK